jgi:ketosteroid isomerase-like protein
MPRRLMDVDGRRHVAIVATVQGECAGIARYVGLADKPGAAEVAVTVEFVDRDLEWTYLDPALEHPTPQACHGRHELERVLRGWAEHGLRAELEEVAGRGELVMVGVWTPGVDAYRVRQADDRNYGVLTVRDGCIVALRDYREVMLS